MPLQNRVTPFGEIVAIPERGTMMGNRGILHDGGQRVRRRWAGRAWICCLLEFRGRRDPVMAPGHYTRLFFLDEPTALAAGHRPCAYCRRQAYSAFRDAWASANRELGLGPRPPAPAIDRRLHEERLDPNGDRRRHPARLAALPDGTMFVATLDGTAEPGPALLRWQGGIWRWTPAGYLQSAPLTSETVWMLTPPSIVAALAGGYRPEPPALDGAPPRPTHD
jgi:hypothetical protein